MGERSNSVGAPRCNRYFKVRAAVCRLSRLVGVLVICCVWCCCAGASPRSQWVELTAENGLAQWQGDPESQAWRSLDDVALNGKKLKTLDARPGQGVIASVQGEGADLKSRQCYGDLDVQLEFLIPRDSNSGVKLMGLYEIQIYDSYGVKKPTANDCGGIYPRAELQPKYHWIDGGTPPLLNAAKPAGEWQTLKIEFKAPRFNTDGQKVSKARFEKVVLNGKIIHKNVEMAYPTGSAWRLKPEVARGPLLLQGDHGPVAFRNVRVRDRATH